jgi:SAM-dependent methyltransferase
MDEFSDQLNPLPDIWSDWLLRKRCGGDPQYEASIRGVIEGIRDRVLDGAQLSAGMTLLDVGAGDGLIAFGALARMGPSLRVVLTDVSVPLLEHAKRCASERGMRHRCTFLHGSADQLEGVAHESVDVVTTRAVLAYVADKAAALREFHRVLKPGGRISIAEPILRDTALEIAQLGRLLGGEGAGANDQRIRLLLRWKSAQYPATAEKIQSNPITNFSERDLVSLCRSTGFGDIHLELHIDVRKKVPISWETLLDLSPHPQAPSLREILRSGFSEEEKRELADYIRPQIESEYGYQRDTVAYLTAIKLGGRPPTPTGSVPPKRRGPAEEAKASA